MAKKQALAKSYRLYAALHEDIAEGFVWLKREGLRARSIIKITRMSYNRRRTIFCEALQFEKNFLTHDNKERRCKIVDDNEASALVINHWYRAKLGMPGLPLETKKEYALEITAANRMLGRLCACGQHPQLVVRVATWLSLIGVGLGVLGVALGALSFYMAAKQTTAASSAPLIRQAAGRQTTSGSEFQPIKTITDIARLSFVNKRCRLWSPDGDIDVDQTCLIVKTAAGGLVAIPNEDADQEQREILGQLSSETKDRDKWLTRFYEIGGGEKSQK